MIELKWNMAEFFIREFAGVLFFFQGYDKLFKVKMRGVIDTFMPEARQRNIPRPMIALIAYYTTIVEFAGGLLLILGLFTDYAAIALGTDLLLVCLAFTVMHPIWDMRHVLGRFILIIALLLLPSEYTKISLDHLLNLR